jgi:DNA-binding MarR family transcriptional regulator
MHLASEIGTMLKQLYRIYSSFVLEKLEARGFADLRPSFLEILVAVSELDGPTLTQVGKTCFLKKQTMTSHINELVKRGYLKKEDSPKDKREQNIYFTELGEKFRLNLQEVMEETEIFMTQKVGSVEIKRVRDTLDYFFQKIHS